MPRSVTRQFTLDPEGIDYISEEVDTFLRASSLDRRSTLAARLAMENVPIGMTDLAGSQAEATLRKRTLLGRPVLILSIAGPRFDHSSNSSDSPWQDTLLESSGVRLFYTYRGGRNIVMLACPRPPLSMLMQILAAALLGVVVASLGMLLSDQVRATLLESIVNPLFDTSVALLSGLAGPTVFASAAWGICGVGDVTALGRSGTSLVGHFLLANLAALPLAFLACALFMPLTGGIVVVESGFIDNISQMLLGMVPTNIIKPFYDGNTLQIIVLAVIVGISILSFEDSNQTLRKLIKELNSLLTLLMDGLCRFIPALVFLMVVMQGWSGTFSSLLDSWLPVVLVTIVMVLYFLLEMLLISFKLKIPLSKVYQICLPTNMIALMTASSAASFGSMVSACEDGFEVDEQLTSFGVPLGIVVCKPSLVVTLVVFMFFCARTYGMGGDLLWYMHLGLAAFFYAIAVPPVPGGMLACYTMLFAELGIPATALALVTAIDLIVDYSTTWGSVCSVILNVAIAGRGFARQEAGRG